MDREELHALLHNFELDKLYGMGEEQFDKLFRRFDTDRSGDIGYAELCAGLKRIIDDLLMLDSMKKQQRSKVGEGVDPFLMSGAPDAAGLPGILQHHLIVSTMNKLRQKDT